MTDPSEWTEPPPRLWTIGHSNVSVDRLIDLLAGARIGVVADIRSVPRSRFVPWFDREPLQAALAEHAIGYVYLGDSLGGRPAAPELYDDAGRLDHAAAAATPAFAAGLDRLLVGVRDHRVATLCAEEDPTHCHRRALVGRAVADHEVEVLHLRGDGTVVSEATLHDAELREQHPSLFDG